MPAGSAYPSGHLVPSPIVGLACAPIVETRFLILAMSLLDFSPRIPLGTCSILLLMELYYVPQHITEAILCYKTALKYVLPPFESFSGDTLCMDLVLYKDDYLHFLCVSF